MSKYIRSILLLLCCFNKIIPLFAHDTAGYNRINLSYAAQYYFNKPNIVGNGIEPDLINTKNNFGRYISLEYERVTRYGLILNVGIRDGVRKHDISMVKDLSKFDTAFKLPNSMMNIDVSTRINYIDPFIMLGYRKPVRRNQYIFAKAGVAQKRYTNRIRGMAQQFTQHIDNNGNYHLVPVLDYEIDMGSPQFKIRGKDNFAFPSFEYIYLFNVGMGWDVKRGFVKNINAVFEITSYTFNETNAQSVFVRSYKYIYSTDLNYSKYADKMISVGVKVGVGLWR